MTQTDTDMRSTEQPSTEQAKAESKKAARLFDLRRLIGGLFLLYGVMLVVAGLFSSSADERKAQGVNINLWTGLGMFAVGAFFAIWAFTRPLELEPQEREEPQTTAPPRQAGRTQEHAASTT
jgi:hypothetical protein